MLMLDNNKDNKLYLLADSKLLIEYPVLSCGFGCNRTKMKLYTFIDENDQIITEVRAENHDQAMAQTGLDFSTDFYSETITENYND